MEILEALKAADTFRSYIEEFGIGDTCSDIPNQFLAEWYENLVNGKTTGFELWHKYFKILMDEQQEKMKVEMGKYLQSQRMPESERMIKGFLGEVVKSNELPLDEIEK